MNWQKRSWLCVSLVAAAALAACGGGINGTNGATGAAGISGISAVIATSTVSAGTYCVTGGTRIDSGPDTNSNGVLDASEITGTQFVCNGPAGAAGTSTTGATGAMGATGATGATGAAGATGATGSTGAAGTNGTNGTAGATGAAGTNGTNGTNGLKALVAMAAEAAGANCTSGGTKITAGLDTNSNGTLDASEVTSIGYVCAGATGATGAAGTNGTNGTNGATGATGATGAAGTNGTNGKASLIAMIVEPAGANCTYAGTKITSGLDTNANGTLDSTEVNATSYVCNGSNTTWTNVTSLAAVQMASNGGYIANNSAVSTVFTLPTAPAIGDVVRVKGSASPGWSVAQNAGQSINLSGLTVYTALAGDTWSLSETSGVNSPGYVTASADGQSVVASFGATVWFSSNGGKNWAQTATPSGSGINAVTISPDGSTIFVNANGVYWSTNQGGTWNHITTIGVTQLISAYNGGLVAIGVVGGVNGPYVSVDHGATWTALTVTNLVATPCWGSVAVSPDGNHIAVTGDGNGSCSNIPVYVTHDAGSTWTASPAVNGPLQNRNKFVAITPSGNNLVVTSGNSGIAVWSSNDGGVTWYAGDTLVQANAAAAISSDGKHIVVAAVTSQAFTSSDSGHHWLTKSPGYDLRSVAGGNSLSTVFGATGAGQVAVSSAALSNSASTTVGTGGSLTGSSADALELMFLGSGSWGPLSTFGSDFLVK